MNYNVIASVWFLGSIRMTGKRAARQPKVRNAPRNGRSRLRAAVTPESILAFPESGGASKRAPSSFDPQVFLKELSVGKATREYKTGEFVFSQGDLADAVFYLQSGKVKLTVVSKRGKEAVVALLTEGSFFGEGCLAGQPLRMSSASAVQGCNIVRVEKAVMLRLIHQEPEFAEQFLAYLLSRNIRMEADLVDHLFNSSEKRLARLLLLLANFGQESKPIPLISKMSQETLADMIGTTRSRVSFFLNRFRELGFIDYNGEGMHVHSSLVSVVLHD
jgi:CRP/FNR family transcriptional regulator, cyclic AMP receptor protein